VLTYDFFPPIFYIIRQNLTPMLLLRSSDVHSCSTYTVFAIWLSIQRRHSSEKYGRTEMVKI